MECGSMFDVIGSDSIGTAARKRRWRTGRLANARAQYEPPASVVPGSGGPPVASVRYGPRD